MNHLTRMSIAALAVLACTAPGCNPIRFEWQGPSSAFNLMDPNHDGRLTRAEWEQTSEMTHPDETFLFGGGSAYEFLTSDCDGDGVYTWHEYFQSRFKRVPCEPTRDDLGVAKFLGVRPAWSALAAHWPALRTSAMTSQFEQMLADVAPSEQVVRQYVHIAPFGREQLEAWYPVAERRMIDIKWVSTPLGAQAVEVTVLGARAAGPAM